MSYYDVDAILTDAQKLPCTVEFDGPNLGFLDGNAGEILKAGTKIQIPLWLGEFLAVSTGAGGVPLATLDLPSSLEQRVINALKADPKTVELRAQAPHFYSLAARVLELLEEDEMVDVLTDTFAKRAAEIADHAHSPRGATGKGVDFLRGLEETERQLFRAAHDGAKATQQWIASSKHG